MARRQCHELLAPTVEERIRADNKRAGVQLDKSGERGVDLAFGAGFQDQELHSLCLSCFLRVPYAALGKRVRRVDQ
jgi:hypothetical protein